MSGKKDSKRTNSFKLWNHKDTTVMENPQNEHKLDNGSLHVGITIRCHQNKRNAKCDTSMKMTTKKIG